MSAVMLCISRHHLIALLLGVQCTVRVNFFPINAPGMGRFQLLNLGGFGLWVRVEVLGSDCNNRFPNTNHNLNHNSNDDLTLTP